MVDTDECWYDEKFRNAIRVGKENIDKFGLKIEKFDPNRVYNIGELSRSGNMIYLCVAKSFSPHTLDDINYWRAFLRISETEFWEKK
jgi:hypothetical protein